MSLNLFSKPDELAFGTPVKTRDENFRALTFGDSPLGNTIIEVFNKNARMDESIKKKFKDLPQFQINDLAAYVSNHKNLDKSSSVWGRVNDEITNIKKKIGGKSRRGKSRRSKSRRSKSRRTV